MGTTLALCEVSMFRRQEPDPAVIIRPPPDRVLRPADLPPAKTTVRWRMVDHRHSRAHSRCRCTAAAALAVGIAAVAGPVPRPGYGNSARHAEDSFRRPRGRPGHSRPGRAGDT